MTRDDSPPTEPTPGASAQPPTPAVRIAPGSGHRKVEAWFDLPALEREVLTLWRESDAFGQLVVQQRGRPPYSFLDGPITANNPMGVHHAWGRTLKDVYQRYWAMNGRRLRYQNGFDCQGLWVEIEVEKEHGLSSKHDVEAFGVARFVEACQARVRKYSAVQTEQSIRLGMWMDWEQSYFTMSEDNNFAIWSFLKRCHARGKIYRGSDVMPWSGRSGSAYSQMEVIEGRKLVAHTALFVRFPLRDRPGENLLIWTTTPWTLTCNVAAAVNAELDYAKLRDQRSGELYYCAAENLTFARLDRQFREQKEWVAGVPKLKTLAQLFNERGGYTLEGTVKGAELVGLAYDGPFDELPAQSLAGGFPFAARGVTQSAREAHRVIDGGRDSHGQPVVVAGEGTGIVHTAPGCGDVDHALGKQLCLPMLAPLDEAACFLEGFGWLTGKHATAAETVEWIVEDLRRKGLLLATERYPHVYPHCWRTGDELVFRLVDEWYIDMGWRDEIKAVVEQVKWVPSWGRERELEWLSNMRDWMISKKRFWGLALPIWVCEQCQRFEVIGGREELKQRAIAGWDAFEGHTPHRPWIDGVKIACPHCGGTAQRVADVGNPWLDAGIVPYSTLGYDRDRDYWREWFPADLVLESFPGQFRNWFYAMLAMSAMIEGVAPFRTLLGHALMRDEHGEEMHKSKGNAIWFDEAADQAGAEAMRWLFAQHEPTANLNFGYGALREVRGGFLNTLWNTYGFYVNYARLEAEPATVEAIAFAALPDFDRWILSELQTTITSCRLALEAYDHRTAARAIAAFVDDLSGWYIRHNRRRFWKSDDRADLRAALQTLGECLRGVTGLVAPLLPFLSEAIYQNLVRAIDEDAPASIHHTAYPTADATRVDQPLTDAMRAIKRLNSLALAAREAKKLKVRQPLALLRIGPKDAGEQQAAERFAAMLRDDLNVKRVEILAPGSPSPLLYRIKPNFKLLGSRLGPKMKAVAAAIAADAERLIAAWRAGSESLELVVGGERVELARAEVELQTEAPPELSVLEEHGSWVAFETTISEALRREGLMRDLLRRLQLLRKESGLEIEDRIHLRWNASGPELTAVLREWSGFLAAELLCLSLQHDPLLTEGAAEPAAAGAAIEAAIEAGGERVCFSVTKAATTTLTA
ncbi:MAG: isoleucine--tRNA ligase [Proteobacteria bacterium]|nr:isoleucine--tRNA ligase [Pseudomonadota bacterium]